MKRILCMLLFVLLGFSPLAANATHSVVPVGDRVYDVLRFGEVKGYIDTPFPLKPYSRSVVVDALEDILEHRSQLSELEIIRIERELARFDGSAEKQSFLNDGVLLSSTEFVGADKPLTATLGLGISSKFYSNIGNVDDFEHLNQLQIYLEGDLGSYVSYRMLGKLMINNINNPNIMSVSGNQFIQGDSTNNATKEYDYLDFAAYAPFMYTKTWDGKHNNGKSWFSGNAATVNWWPEGYAGAFGIDADITASFLDNRVQLRFGRGRHSIGPMEHGIFLSSQARPFAAIEMVARPAKWLSISSVIGTMESFYSELDYVNNPDSYVDASGANRNYAYLIMAQRQKMYSATVIELKPFSWLTLGAVDTVVFSKRYELGYLHPFLLPFLYQESIGDFDNGMAGGYMVFSIGSYGRVYAALNIDEIRLGKNIFSNARNTFAYQIGAEGNIPWLPLSVVTVQYTKIEPFTYTHNRVVDPSNSAGQIVDGKVVETGTDISFVNNGEGIGSYLKPNSDEFLFDLEMVVSSPFTLGLKYQFIRHGWLGAYNKDVDGNNANFGGAAGGEYNTPLEYQGTAYKNRPKSFLKDGTYEWYHIIGVRGEFDFTEYGAPLQVGGSFTYAHRYLTITPDKDGDGYIDLGEDYEFLEGSRSNRFNLALSFKYWL